MKASVFCRTMAAKRVPTTDDDMKKAQKMLLNEPLFESLAMREM